jgi:hypothetical protein
MVPILALVLTLTLTLALAPIPARAQSTVSSTCNNQGYYYPFVAFPSDGYCTCVPGYTGRYCTISILAIPDLQPCDCGVAWTARGDIVSSAVKAGAIISILPPTTGPIVDSDAYYAASGKVVVPYNSAQLVGHVAQAMHACYSSIACDGFICDTSSGSLRVSYFTTQATTSNLMGIGGSASWYTLARNTNYACGPNQPQAAGMALDVAYYYNANYNEINADCARFFFVTSASLKLPFSYNYPPPTSVSECTSNALLYNFWATLHWSHRGHTKRYSPNAGCALQPTLYDASAMCATPQPGCFGYPNPVTDYPCSQQGYCTAAATVGTFQCACLNYSPDQGGQPIYSGRACQDNIASYCSGVSSALTNISLTLCSGYATKCTTNIVWDGLSVFSSSALTTASIGADYHPSCHCQNNNLNLLPVTGQFCEVSRCGANRCNVLVDPVNACLVSSATDNNGVFIYACVCSNRWTGQFCEVSAITCMLRGVKCSGHGSCVVNTKTHLAECVCDSTNFSGQYCQDQNCPPEVMIPGGGVCINNAISYCYPVFGGVDCGINLCTAFGNGTIAPFSAGQTHPTACTCGPGFAVSVPGDVSCWPLCSVHNGAVCGSTDNTCNLLQLGTVRTAECHCNANYIPVRDRITGAGVCDLYCLNGGPDPNAVWDALNPPMCFCPNTGFDTANNRPRCDNPICANGGIFDVDAQTCSCNLPFTPDDNCVSNTCDNLPVPSGLTKGIVLNATVYGQQVPECFCSAPFGPLFAGYPFDCDYNYCGMYGSPNPAWYGAQPLSRMCKCVGRFKSVCSIFTDISTCNFCTVSTCLNGGYPSVADARVCACKHPYTNGPAGVCELSTCSVHAVSFNISGCFCATGYNGTNCAYALPVTLRVSSSSSSSSSTGRASSTALQAYKSSSSSSSSTGARSSSSSSSSGIVLRSSSSSSTGAVVLSPAQAAAAASAAALAAAAAAAAAQHQTSSTTGGAQVLGLWIIIAGVCAILAIT